jgi:hypothetical protein
MVSMSDELKERNVLKLILVVRFACATLDVGHPIRRAGRNSPSFIAKHLTCHDIQIPDFEDDNPTRRVP